jgi:hypothetical protein
MAMNKGYSQNFWIDNERNARIDFGDYSTATRIKESASTTKISISGESVSFAVGVAGTTGVVALAQNGVYDSTGSRIGRYGDTSFSWVTGTILTTEVVYRKDQIDTVQLAALADGEFAIDYDLGRIRYCKATNGTSDTCNYTIRELKVDTELTISGVTIDNVKVFSTDGTAANSKYAFAATDGMAADGTKHAAVMAGYDVTNSKAQHLRQMKGDAAANAGYHLSVAGEVVDFDTGAGTDYTPVIGVLGASAGGAKSLYLVNDDSAMDATPITLPVSSEYRAVATTYTDGDATVLQSDVNGYLKVATSGTSKYENASFDEVEDESNDSEFNTSVIYGYDSEAAANNKLRATQVAVDNAGVSATPNVLINGGVYKNALDTYDDNDAVPFHFTVNGKLLTDAEVTLNDYTDDSNEYTVASSKMLAIGGIATSDSVDANDVGAFRMTLARNLGVDITTKDGSAWAVGNAINVTVGDGTTVPVVETAGTKKALNVNITDGTNDMPTMDANNRPGFVKITDGAQEWSIDGSGFGQVDIAAQSLTAVKVSKDANANSSTNPIYVKEVSAGTDVVVVTATGAAAINTTTAITAEFKLLKVLCHFSSAPTTSENFVVTLDSNAGAAYDTALMTRNPSLSSATDLVYIPEGDAKFVAGDEIKVTFTNTDTRTYGLSIYYQLM